MSVRNIKPTKRMLKALRSCIADRWEPFSKQRRVTPDPTCSLCGIYMDKNRNCHHCPIQSDTGRENCLGTPYYSRWGGDRRIKDIKAMLNYLKGLERRLLRKYNKEK